MSAPRDPYDDDETPLAFDRRRPSRTRGPAPVTLFISLLVLIMAGGGVFLLYRGGARAPDGPPQPVGAPLRDVKTAAPPQAQPTDPSAGLSIYKDDPNAPARAPAFAPPPEEPVSVAPSPAPPAAVPAHLAPAPTVDDLVEAARRDPQPVKPAVQKTRTASPPAKPPAVAKAATPSANTASKSASIVQIGAFSTASLADRAWNEAAAISPGAMAGKGKRVTPFEKNDGTTLYRTAITGFASREAAVALCDHLIAGGKSCFVH